MVHGVIDVRLSSELQTAQRAAVPAARNSGLVAALAAVMACASLVAGVQTGVAHPHALPALFVVLLGVLACGAIVLHNRRGRSGLRHRSVQQPMQGSGKFDTPAPTIQSLGGSSVPSFGSRPNTALSAGSPDISPATDSILGTTRQVVRFSSAEVLASRASPSGSPSAGPDPMSSAGSRAAGGESSPLAPLCRALVLPSNEAHLQIQLSAIAEARQQAARGSGEFHVLGPLGNRLLRAEVRSAGNERSLEIFMASASDTLARNARVVGVSTQDAGTPGLLVTGPEGRAYGELVPGKGGLAVLCPGRQRPALVLVGDAAGLQLSASSGEDGRHLASSGLGRAPGGGDRLEVRVHAGVDTALVLACILAAVLFS